MKKLLSALLSIALLAAVFSASGSMTALAVMNDGNMLSADIDLQVYKDGSPLASGAALKAGDIITVRICPVTDFYTGVARFAVMFSKEYFQIVGSGNSAFTPNTANSFYKAVAPGYSGATNVPKTAWPAEMASQFDTYTAVCVNNSANSNSANGGFPMIMNTGGDWLFSFDLKSLKDISSGSGARIWIDSRWFRSPANSTAAAYLTKCTGAEQMSAQGNSTSYYFDIDLSGADIILPVGSPIPATTKPVITTAAPTTPGSTTALPPPASTNPGDTTASTELTQTTGVPATTAEPVKVPQEDLDAAVDKAGIENWDGNMANLTPEQKEAVKQALEESGKTVEEKDDGFYYVETTVPGETATNADGSPAAEDADGSKITPNQKKAIIAASVAAVLVIAGIAVFLAKKKK